MCVVDNFIGYALKRAKNGRFRREEGNMADLSNITDVIRTVLKVNEEARGAYDV